MLIQQYNLQLQFRKCRWGCTKLKFLGYVISAAGIQMDPEKINSITAFPQPTSIKTLQSFLGLINFSLRFVPNLAAVTAPLRTLLAKDAKFHWTEECHRSFLRLKELVRKTSILAHPDFSHPFKLQTDASNQGLGAVLLQQNKQHEWQAIAYISRSLTKSEQNYSTTEKELLAIVWAFQKFHPYLHGLETEVETDHQPLVSLIHKHHPPGRLLRWALALQEYTFTLIYCRGSTNVVADVLSRTEHQVAQLSCDTDTLPLHRDQLVVAQQQDPALLNIIRELRNSTMNQAKSRFILINDVLHRVSADQDPRIYLPKSLQTDYLSFYHDHPLCGHLGFHKVLNKLRTHYYWPKMRHDISNYLQTCQICQHVKDGHRKVG